MELDTLIQQGYYTAMLNICDRQHIDPPAEAGDLWMSNSRWTPPDKCVYFIINYVGYTEEWQEHVYHAYNMSTGVRTAIYFNSTNMQLWERLA